MFPQAPPASDTWWSTDIWWSTDTGRFNPGSAYSNDTSTVTSPLNYRHTTSLSTEHPLPRRTSRPAVSQTPLIPILPQIFGSVPCRPAPYDPIVDMHLMLQKTTDNEDSDPASTLLSPTTYAKDLTRATSDRFSSLGGMRWLQPEGLGLGSLHYTELNLFDLWHVSQESALSSPWTMDWTIEGMSTATEMTILNVRLSCDGAPLDWPLKLYVDLMDCRLPTGAHEWKWELSQQLQVAQSHTNST